MTLEELKADLLPDPLGDAVELTSAQIEFLLLAPEILALVEACDGCQWAQPNEISRALDAFNAKLASL